jgi:hypothetical protein
MVVQVKKKVLVLDQPFLQPDAVRGVEVLEGLDGVHGSAFHLTHRIQPIRPRIGFRSRSPVRMAIQADASLLRGFSRRSPDRGLRQPPGPAREGVGVLVDVMVGWAWLWRSATLREELDVQGSRDEVVVVHFGRTCI